MPPSLDKKTEPKQSNISSPPQLSGNRHDHPNAKKKRRKNPAIHGRTIPDHPIPIRTNIFGNNANVPPGHAVYRMVSTTLYWNKQSSRKSCQWAYKRHSFFYKGQKSNEIRRQYMGCPETQKNMIRTDQSL